MPRRRRKSGFTGWISDQWERLVDLRELATRQTRRRTRGIAYSLIDALSSFESVESIVRRGLRRLFRPFGKLLQMTGLGDLFGFLFELPGRVLRRVRSVGRSAARRVGLGGVLDSFGRVFGLLLTPFTALAGFAYAWAVTRNRKDMLLAIPAVLMLAPFVYVGFSASLRGPGPVAARYEKAMREARQEGDHQVAELYREKLVQLGVDNSRAEYIEALKLVEQGDISSGYDLMQRLAPPEIPGYSAAHYWIALRLLTGEELGESEQTPDTPEERLTLAEQHLDRIVELGGNAPQVIMLQAIVYARTDREKKACEVLEPYADEIFAAAAMRLRMLVRVGDDEAATTQAQAVPRLFASLGLPASKLSADEHRSRVLAATLLKDEPQKELTLIDWQQTFPDDPQPNQLLAQLTRERVQSTLDQQSFDPEALVERLCRAERLGSPRAWVALQLRDLIENRETSASCREAWAGLLGSPDASEPLIELAGTTAALRGEILQARKAFQRLAADGDAPALVWNNLAWSLLQEPRPIPSAALEAISKAIEQEPDSPVYRETRGQAEVMLKRWEPAVADLKYALEEFPDNQLIHLGLARSYEALGQRQLAADHWERSGGRRPPNLLREQ